MGFRFPGSAQQLPYKVRRVKLCPHMLTWMWNTVHTSVLSIYRCMWVCEDMHIIKGIEPQWHLQMNLFSQRDFKPHNMESRWQINPVFLSNIPMALRPVCNANYRGAEGKNVDLTKLPFQQLGFFFCYGNKRTRNTLFPTTRITAAYLIIHYPPSLS